MKVHCILYVADQERSSEFYRAVLRQLPSLDVAGMTEFTLGHDLVLGLMPEAGAARLLGESVTDPAIARGVPRIELYLVVPDPEAYHARAVAAGAREVSRFTERDWGHSVAYSLDPDGHVLAFADEIKS